MISHQLWKCARYHIKLEMPCQSSSAFGNIQWPLNMANYRQSAVANWYCTLGTYSFNEPQK